MTVSTLLDFLKDKDPDTKVYLAKDSTDFLTPVAKAMDGSILDYTDTTKRDVVIDVIYLEGFDEFQEEEE